MRSLMLVSASVDTRLREEVSLGLRPTPEYLWLEKFHDVELLDWSRSGLSNGHRTAIRSIRHVAAAWGRLSELDVIFSDGEHVGIPLAAALRATQAPVRHLMIGHNMLTAPKARILRASGARRRIDRLIVHSSNQLDNLTRDFSPPNIRLAVVPYGIDTQFWSPQNEVEEKQLMVSAGREHRDYRTLVAALPKGARLTIADSSPFTPHALRQDPDVWPTSVERVALQPSSLRSLYGRAAVVVVPVIASQMPAGITTLLEAMAMGKAVIVTETEGLQGVIEDGVSGVVVRPRDAEGMRLAIERLLVSPSLRHSLGTRARQVAIERYSLDVYSSALARHLAEVAVGVTSGRDPDSG